MISNKGKERALLGGVLHGSAGHDPVAGVPTLQRAKGHVRALYVGVVLAASLWSATSALADVRTSQVC